MSDIEWVEVPASGVMVGDRTKWGYGRGMENKFRTVSRLEDRGNGIVAIYHRETWEPFHETYAHDWPIRIVRRDIS